MWWNTILSVWYTFSIDTKTKWINIIVKISANYDSIAKNYHSHELDELLMSLRSTKIEFHYVYPSFSDSLERTLAAAE